MMIEEEKLGEAEISDLKRGSFSRLTPSPMLVFQLGENKHRSTAVVRLLFKSRLKKIPLTFLR